MPSTFLSVLLTIKFTSHNHLRDKCYCYLPGMDEGTEAKGIEEMCPGSRSPWAPQALTPHDPGLCTYHSSTHLLQAVQSRVEGWTPELMKRPWTPSPTSLHFLCFLWPQNKISPLDLFIFFASWAPWTCWGKTGENLSYEFLDRATLFTVV